MTRVLIADDERLVANAFARLLTSDGHDVETTSDGRSALELLHSKPFDVVVSDVSMPEMTGLELLRALREKGSRVPVVLVTAGPAIEGAMQAVEYGAVRYLAKPVDSDSLRKIVSHAARASQAVEHVADPQDERHEQSEKAFANALQTLWMAYQPIVSSSQRKVIAYEGLVRNEEQTLRRPDLLLKCAEEMHRLTDLGRTVRGSVADDANGAPPEVSIFTNLHVRDLLDEQLYDPFAPLGAMAKRVVLEITERASLSHIADLRYCIHRLKKLGFRIAVDDLGAGYAGLTSISQLEPDVVKLDMTLIRNVDSNTTNQRLVRSMLDVCRELGAEVVCEGVETEAERKTLVALGADLLQGYLFARPGRAFPSPILVAV